MGSGWLRLWQVREFTLSARQGSFCQPILDMPCFLLHC
jgi:hypothetical protein